ncbi:MAG: ABC transporter ATP-binding protein [Flavobacteriales bacterium]|nr:ABC transporter ATP-binding protein [Flavobacteriales bacterium]
MTHLIDVQNLNIYFDSNNQPIQVVKNFNLTLQTGQIVGIVGESGSGKSVSLLSLTRLIENARLQSDKMSFFVENEEIDLLHANQSQLRKIRGNHISYIFQEPMTALHPLFTCGFQVAESIMLHQHLDKNKALKKAIELFDEMRLPNAEAVAQSYPHQLSGGQRQRVMIALALANNPDVVVADEPTTALDSILQKDITEKMVMSCKQRQTGLVLISHDIKLIQEYTDHLIVMYKGSMVEQGKTADVVQNPQSIYTQSLLQCQPNLSKKSQVLPTIHELANYDGNSFIPKSFVNTLFEFKPIENEAYISISNLNKTFRNKNRTIQALANINFDIFKGETLGLIGESGCGKSTLSKIIIGLLQADSGEILFSGKPAYKQRKEFAKKVQMIFQDPYSSLNPSMKVGKIIGEVLSVHGITDTKSETKLKVEQLLIEVGLKPSDYDKYPHEFSGGQRQRISIARALAVEPDLIICDESVSALDVSVQAQILNLFNQLKATRQLTYLFISHDLNVVSYICDRILVMQNGEIVEQGSAEKIVTNPENSYTKVLLSGVR